MFALVPSTEQYLFPPPSGEFIRFVTKLLLTNATFYTNVRYLINAMRIEIPFGLDNEWKQVININKNKGETDDESTEDNWEPCCSRSAPSNRLLTSRLRSFKNSKSFNRSVQPSENLWPKKILKFNIDSLRNGVPPQATIEQNCGSFGQFACEKSASIASTSSDKYPDAKFDFRSSFTLDYIRKNRLSSREMSKMKIFDQNARIDPSLRLYVKNIPKNSREIDLWKLFGAFVPEDDLVAQQAFDLRFMQKGPLRGQAFVVYKDLGAAKRAMRETNGFLLNNKPLVVMFSRSSHAS